MVGKGLLPVLPALSIFCQILLALIKFVKVASLVILRIDKYGSALSESVVSISISLIV